MVDKRGCVVVKTNAYSVPARAGIWVEARVHPLHVEVWHAGRCIARHEHCHSRRQQVLDLDHYLNVLGHKPGVMAGSKPLEPSVGTSQTARKSDGIRPAGSRRSSGRQVSSSRPPARLNHSPQAGQ